MQETWQGVDSIEILVGEVAMIDELASKQKLNDQRILINAYQV